MLLQYIILGLVALYLFKVNPFLCVALVAAVLFFKFRRARGKRGGNDRRSAALEAALVTLVTRLLEREDAARADPASRGARSPPRNARSDRLGGLFRE